MPVRPEPKAANFFNLAEPIQNIPEVKPQQDIVAPKLPMPDIGDAENSSDDEV